MAYNKVIFIGNLTKDPELRYTPSGTAVCGFRIAVNSKYGEKEETLFIDIVTFAKQAENCSKYISKGSTVLVEGRLTERKWESDSGPKSKMEVNANAVQFLSKNKNGKTNGSSYDGPPPPEDSEREPF